MWCLDCNKELNNIIQWVKLWDMYLCDRFSDDLTPVCVKGDITKRNPLVLHFFRQCIYTHTTQPKMQYSKPYLRHHSLFNH